jgi:c-di-AMP phosphodiesterase-like protein
MQLQEKHGIQHKVEKTKEKRYKLYLLAKERYSIRLDLLTVVDDAVRLVCEHHHNKPKQIVVDLVDDNYNDVRQQQLQLNN